MKKMILQMELVPQKSWYKSLRDIISSSKWKKIREAILLEYKNKCSICKVIEKSLNCHETWEYDEKNHIQKLTGFICLCNKCHFIKHFGFAQVLAERNKLNLNDVINHFLKVNKCTIEDFEIHKKEIFKIWRERSKSNWQIEYGPYQELVNEYL